MGHLIYTAKRTHTYRIVTEQSVIVKLYIPALLPLILKDKFGFRQDVRDGGDRCYCWRLSGSLASYKRCTQPIIVENDKLQSYQ